jgi:two-component system, NarL family, sensor kinase
VKFLPAVYFIIILGYSSAVNAQDQQKITSILQKIANEKTDTGKVMLLNNLYVEYREYDSSKAMKYVNEGIELANSIGFDKGEALLLMNKGVFLNLNGENDAAKNLIQQSLEIRKRTNDFAGQGFCLRSLGNIEYDKNNYEKALALYLQASPLFEKANDKKGLAGNYIWVGNVFNEGLRQYDKATEYFSKSLALALELNDSSLISYNYNNLGQAFYFQKKYNQAFEYYYASRDIKRLLNDKRGLGNAFGNISNIYFDTANYALALIYNDSALQIRTEQNDKKGIATSLANGGNILLLLKNYEAAFNNYQKALKLGTEIEFKEPVIESYNGLSKYYEQTGNASQALTYYKLYKTANDSVYNSDIAQQIAVLQTRYETAKKEQEIKDKNFQISKRNYWIAAISVLLLLGSLLGYSYYRRFKLKKEKQLQAEIMHQQDIATRGILQAEENERERIARELHDGVGQMMSAAKMNLSAMEHDLAFTNENQKNAFDRIVNLVDEGCKEVRTVSHQMMPNALLKKGLASAIREFIDKIDNRVLKVDLYSEGLNERIDTNTETVLYRVVQECVNNVIKHSGANHLDISLIKDTEGISVTIEDNGKGFDTTQKANFDGIGLKNIRTRIEYLKGTVDFDSTPGNGTLVAIHVPVAV